MNNYYKVQDGEWIRPTMDGWRMQCCDCGLVHVVDFAIENDQNRVLMRALRDVRKTAAVRRERKKRAARGES